MPSLVVMCSRPDIGDYTYVSSTEIHLRYFAFYLQVYEVIRTINSRLVMLECVVSATQSSSVVRIVPHASSRIQRPKLADTHLYANKAIVLMYRTINMRTLIGRLHYVCVVVFAALPLRHVTQQALASALRDVR